MARMLVRSILNFCLPRECASCRSEHESEKSFCPACEQELEQLELVARCRRCSMPITLPGAPCAQCLGKGVSPFKSIASLGVLKDPLKSAIHRMKYENKWSLANRLADRLYARSDVRALLENADLLIPVPLHVKRQRERGYNQAEVIARQLGKLSDVRVLQVASRIRSTQSQANLGYRAKRFENLRDAFELIDGKSIAGKNNVLVDDVLTTGATLTSLARALRPAKPARLSAVVLAVADPKGREFEVI